MDLTKREQDMLDMLDKHADRMALVAGIVECRTALSLANRGLVEVISGEVTEQGGSGVIRAKLRLVEG